MENNNYLKKLLILFIITFIFISIPIQTVSSTGFPPRHVNPIEVCEEKSSPLALLTLYRVIVDFVSTRDYGSATLKLQEALRVYAPADLRYVLNMFNKLLNDEIKHIKKTDECIKLSRKLLNLGLLEEAENKTREGFKHFTEAKLTYLELEKASIRLSSLIPVDLTPILNNLKKVLDQQLKRLKDFSQEIREKENIGIAKTTLKIWVDKEEVWVGSKLNIFGVLLGNSLGLSDRKVNIYFGESTYSITTTKKGFFKLSLDVPYTYKPEVEVYAVFIPIEDDVGVYSWSKSNTIKVKLLYNKPFLNASLDKVKAKPLETFTVQGYVQPSKLRIWVKAFKTKEDLTTNLDGSFKLTLKVPAWVKEGVYPIEVGSYAEGVTATASTRLSLRVYRLPLSLTFNFPSLALTSLGFEVSGFVFHDGEPLKDAKVLVKGFGERVETKTDLDGSFKVYFTIPYNLCSGSYPLTVTVKPSKPWLKSLHRTVTVPLLNIYTVTIPIALTTLLVGKILDFKRKPKLKISKKKSLVALPFYSPPTEKIPQGIPGIYFEAVKIIESYTGEKMLPTDTVREYLLRVKPYLGEAFQPFQKLSFMLEDEVYGRLKHSMEEAEQLLKEIRKTVG